MFEDKTRFTALVILVLAVIVSGALFYNKTRVPKEAVYKMSGSVSALSGDSITVTGNLIGRVTVVRDKNAEIVPHTVEFTISPETVFEKKVIFIAKEHQVEEGVSEIFTPATFTSPGKLSDLYLNIPIIEIQSSGNIMGEKEAIATLIKYQLLEYER